MKKHHVFHPSIVLLSLLAVWYGFPVVPLRSQKH